MEKDWRSKTREIRAKRLEWMLANLDVSKYDPYNPVQMDELTNHMMKIGVIPRHNNASMQSRAIETLLIEARKIRKIR